MLNFIQGRPGSGKTSLLIRKKIYAHVKAGKKAEILVPKQISFTSEEKILSYLGPEIASVIDVYSFRRLADKLFAESKETSKAHILSGVSSVIMAGLITSMKDKFQYFNKRIDNNLILQLLEQVRYLKSCNITLENLELVRDKVTGNLRKKISDLILVYEAYTEAISSKYYDENDILSEIYAIVSKEQYFKGKVIAVDGFTYMTMQEMRLIALAVEQAEEVYVTVAADDIYSHDRSGVFTHSCKCARDLISVVKSSCPGVKINVIDADELNDGFDCRKSEEIRLIERNLYKNDVHSDMECTNVKMYKALNPDDECDFVAREIKKLMRFGNYRCRDIAVAFRSFGEYKGRLFNSFKKYGIPAFEDKRQPVRNTPLVVYVSSLLKLASDSRYDTESILRYLKSGLSPLDEEKISLIENYAYMWSISGSQWILPFTKNPEGFGKKYTEKAEKKLEELESIRLEFMPQIKQFVDSVKECTGREFCEKIYYFLKSNKVDDTLAVYAAKLEKGGDLELALEQDDVWVMLMKVLDELVIALGEKYVSPSDFLEYFDLVIETKSFGKVPNHYDEVMVSSFDRLLNYMPKVLFSVGCNSGTFPNYDQDHGIFSSFECNEILEAGPDMMIVDDDINSIEYERFLVYLALTTAEEKLYISCSETDFEARKQEPSEIFNMVERILDNVQTIPYTDSIEDCVQSEDSAFEQYVRKIKSGSDDAASLRAYFEENGDRQKQLKAIDSMLKNETFEIKDKHLATELFGRNMYFSATSIEKYESCPFKYFCSDGLKLKNLEKAEFDKRNLGTVAHEVLETIMKNHMKDYFVPENKPELEKEARELLGRFLEEKMGGAEDKDARFMYVYYRTMRILSDAIGMVITELNNTDFIPDRFELEIGGKEIESYRLELDEGYIELHGKIDRVDSYNTEDKVYVKIVDYKTGSKSFELYEAVQGLNTQMLLYLMAILENGNTIFNKDIKPAAVIYSLVKRLSKESSNKTQEGMILDDNDIIGKLYLSTNQGNKKAPSAVMNNKFSEDDFRLISNKIRNLIVSMGNNLHNGNIRPNPIRTQDGDKCKYCPYDGICAKNNGVEYRDIRKMDFNSVINQLREEESNSGN